MQVNWGAWLGQCASCMAGPVIARAMNGHVAEAISLYQSCATHETAKRHWSWVTL